MGAVADTLTSPEWAQKPPLEKAAARKDLFALTLKQNPEFAQQFQSATEEQQQKLYDGWRTDLESKFPDAFTTKGYVFTRKEKEKDASPVAREATMPVLDYKTEATLAKLDLTSSEGLKLFREYAKEVKGDTPQAKSLRVLLRARYGDFLTPEDTDGKIDDESVVVEKEPTLGEQAMQLAPTAVRVAGPASAGVIAGIAGQLGPQVATPEEAYTVPAAMAGGAAAVEPFAQWLEKKLGQRKEYSVGQGALNVAFSAIPGSRQAKGASTALKLGVRAAEGAALGSGYNAIDQAIFGEKPFSIEENIIAGVTGGVTGGVVEGLAQLAPKVRATLMGKSREQLQADLPALIEKAETPEIRQQLEQLEKKLGIGAEVKSAAESAIVISRENPPVIKSAADSAGVISAELAAREIRASDFNKARVEEAAMGIGDARLSGDESVIFSSPESAQIAAAQTRRGNSARELTKLEKRGERIEPPSAPTPEMSQQAQRMLEQYGAANPAVITSMAGGVVGGAAGATQGETLEERIRNTAVGAVAGLAGGAALARSISRQRPEQIISTLTKAAKEASGTDKAKIEKAVKDIQYQYTHQPAEMFEGRKIPGYTQIDVIEGGVNTRSTNLEQLAREGVVLPRPPDGLPAGRYKAAEIEQMVSGMGGQRMAEQVAAGSESAMATPAFFRNVGIPLTGGATGVAYGLYEGTTPEERASKAMQYGLLGLGAGSIGGRVIMRDPKAMLKDVKKLTQGESNLPKWALSLRDNEKIVRLRETIGNNPLARPQRAISKQFQETGVPVPEEQNFWLRATNFPGITKAKVSALAEEAAQDIKYKLDSTLNDISKASGKPYDEYAALLNDYIVARHAPSVNKLHPEYAAENPGKFASGMSDADAAKIVEDVKARGLDKYFEPLREQIRDFNKAALDERVAAGLISRKEADTLLKKYPEYVPLNRVMDEEDNQTIISSLFGPKKFSVLSSGVRKLEGSQREVEDVLVNTFINMRDAVVRGEQNRVAQQLRDFYKAHPSPDVVIKPFRVGEQSMPNQVNVRYQGADGRTHVDAIVFRDPLFAKAMNGLGKYQADAVDRTIGKFTGLLTALYTRFEPSFQIKNKVRDLQDALKYAAATGDVQGGAKLAAKGISAIGAVHDGITGKNTPGAALYKRAELAGAFTGGISPVNRKEVEKLLASYSPNKPVVKQAAEAAINGVNYVNDVLNQSTYLPIFERLISQGATDAEAALAARKASIDFDLKSDAVKKMSVLYGFVGPSIHGVKNAGKWAVRNPRTIGEAVVAFTGAAIAVDKINQQFDPNWKRRKQMDGYRASGIPIAFSGDAEGYYVFNIPVSQSARLIKGAGDAAADATSGETFDVDYTSERLGKIAMDSLNFMGGRNARQIATPTLIDPLSDVWANESFAGTPIMPNADRTGLASSQVYMRTADTQTGAGAVSASRWLRDNIGWDVSPEALLYSLRGYGGGPAKLAMDTADTAGGKPSGGKTSPNRFPLLGGFVKYVKYDSPLIGASDKKLEQELATASDTKVDARAEGYKAFQQFQAAQTDEEKIEIAKQVFQRSPEAYKALEGEVKRGQKRITSGNADNIRMLLSLGVESGDRAKSIARMTKEMDREEAIALLEELYKAGGLGKEVQKQLSAINSAGNN